MLRKLIKYDMRYIGRIVPWVYLAAISVSILMSLMLYLSSVNSYIGVLAGLTAIPYLIVTGVISISGFIMIAIRVYKNLYSDEGYLTFTLPVTIKQQILSKIFSGAIWELLGFVVAIVCLAMPIVTAYCSFDEIRSFIVPVADSLMFTFKMFYNEHSVRVISLAVIFVIIVAVSVFSNPVTLLLSCSIGQFSKKNRMLLSIGAYFGIQFALSTVMSIVTTVITAIATTGSIKISGDSSLAMLDAYIWAFGAEAVLFIIYYIITYFIVKKIMTDKLNLI